MKSPKFAQHRIVLFATTGIKSPKNIATVRKPLTLFRNLVVLFLKNPSGRRRLQSTQALVLSLCMHWAKPSSTRFDDEDYLAHVSCQVPWPPSLSSLLPFVFLFWSLLVMRGLVAFSENPLF